MTGWLVATLAFFAAGITTLATIPPVGAGNQLAAGYVALTVAFMCLAKALPEEPDGDTDREGSEGL